MQLTHLGGKVPQPTSALAYKDGVNRAHPYETLVLVMGILGQLRSWQLYHVLPQLKIRELGQEIQSSGSLPSSPQPPPSLLPSPSCSRPLWPQPQWTPPLFAVRPSWSRLCAKDTHVCCLALPSLLKQPRAGLAVPTQFRRGNGVQRGYMFHPRSSS